MIRSVTLGTRGVRIMTGRVALGTRGVATMTKGGERELC